MLVSLNHFGILDNNILLVLVDLCFDLAAHKFRKAVFGLTSNVSINGLSNYIELGFVTGIYVQDEI